jgi:hypothetical protein
VSKFNAYQLRLWSIRVRRRDKRCVICGSMERREAHHVYCKSYYPELAYDLANGVTLCGSDKKTGNRCHHAFHILYKLGYRKKCTRDDWERFVRLAEWGRGQNDSQD